LTACLSIRTLPAFIVRVGTVVSIRRMTVRTRRPYSGCCVYPAFIMSLNGTPTRTIEISRNVWIEFADLSTILFCSACFSRGIRENRTFQLTNKNIYFRLTRVYDYDLFRFVRFFLFSLRKRFCLKYYLCTCLKRSIFCTAWTVVDYVVVSPTTYGRVVNRVVGNRRFGQGAPSYVIKHRRDSVFSRQPKRNSKMIAFR